MTLFVCGEHKDLVGAPPLGVSYEYGYSSSLSETNRLSIGALYFLLNLDGRMRPSLPRGQGRNRPRLPRAMSYILLRRYMLIVACFLFVFFQGSLKLAYVHPVPSERNT